MTGSLSHEDYPFMVKVKFWGVRGSIATPGPTTVRYGGNTSCVQATFDDTILIFDAGTGLRELGYALMALKRPLTIHLFISHTHWDHIQGLPFFLPIFVPGNDLHIYGPLMLEKSLEDIVMSQLQYSYFPVRGAELGAKITFHEMKEETIKVEGRVEVQSKSLNHPIRNLAYRAAAGGKSMVYTGDNEPYFDILSTEDDRSKEDTGFRMRKDLVDQMNQGIVDFVKGVDLLICDAQYTDEEYAKKVGWGHSTFNQALDLAARAGARRLCLFHHEPARNDAEIDRLVEELRQNGKTRKLPIEINAAQEGLEISL